MKIVEKVLEHPIASFCIIGIIFDGITNIICAIRGNKNSQVETKLEETES